MNETVDSEEHMHLYTLIRQHGYTSSSETVDLVDAIIGAGYELNSRYRTGKNLAPGEHRSLTRSTAVNRVVTATGWAVLAFAVGLFVGAVLLVR